MSYMRTRGGGGRKRTQAHATTTLKNLRPSFSLPALRSYTRFRRSGPGQQNVSRPSQLSPPFFPDFHQLRQAECEKDMIEPDVNHSPCKEPSKSAQNAQRCREKGNMAKENSKKQKYQEGNLRRLEIKFHNASLRISFKIFSEAHPRGIMMFSEKKNKTKKFNANGWPWARAWICCLRRVSLFISNSGVCGCSGRSPQVIQWTASS